jgi:hypothetical protein
VERRRKWRAEGDGADLTEALQTIREIGDETALNAAIEDAFLGSRIAVIETEGLFEVSMRQEGLPRPLRASEVSDGTLRSLCLAAQLRPLQGCSGRNSQRAAREGRPWPAFTGRGSATTFKFSSGWAGRRFVRNLMKPRLPTMKLHLKVAMERVWLFLQLSITGPRNGTQMLEAPCLEELPDY